MNALSQIKKALDELGAIPIDGKHSDEVESLIGEATDLLVCARKILESQKQTPPIRETEGAAYVEP